MAMQTVQTILCRAAIDGAFLATLQAAPRRALQPYDLSADEVDLLTDRRARSLSELAAVIEAWRRGEPRSVAEAQFAHAG